MSVFEEIKQRLRVEDVLGDYVEVIPAGANYKCICPFHNERTPSLMISPDRGVWHCFGCGAGGDIFQFVQDFENIEIKDALKRLAQKANVTLEKSARPKTEAELAKQDTLEQGYELLAWTKTVYHKILSKLLLDRTHAVTRYCLERGLSQEIIEKFEIGYAPSGNLIQSLAKKHALDHTLLASVGVLREAYRGPGYRDKFTDRLVIPIHDEHGRTVGFTGRVLPSNEEKREKDRPKYLNSAASLWFNKSELWFGLNLAKRRIFQEKKALVVEGNMDVIAAHAEGLDYTVASQGTAFTPDQLGRLRKITSHLLLAFDNDSAGTVAGEKFFRQATAHGFLVDKVVIPAPHKDLDDYLHSSAYTDPDSLQTTPYLSFVIGEYQERLLSGDAHEKQRVIEHILGLIGAVDSLTAELYLAQLSDLTNVSRATLDRLYQAQHATTTVKTPPTPNNDPDQTSTPNPLEPHQTEHASLLVAFHKLILAGTNETTLSQVYPLLKLFGRDLREDTYEEYRGRIEPELNLLREAGVYRDTDPVLLLDSILLFLDRRVSQFLLRPELLEAYRALRDKKEPEAASNSAT